MRSWTASVSRRTNWAIVDALVVGLSALAGLYVSSVWTNIEFDIKFTPIKFAFVFAAIFSGLVATSAVHVKAFRRWQTYTDNLARIASGCALGALGLFLVFALTPSKPLRIAGFDSLVPAGVALMGLGIMRLIEHVTVSRLYRGTIVLFVEPEPQWYEAFPEVREALEEDWRLALVALSPRDASSQVPAGVEVWDRGQLSEWINAAEREQRKAVLVFGDYQPKSELHEQLLRTAYSHQIPTTNMEDFYEEILEKAPLFEHPNSWFSSTGLARPRYRDLILKRIMDLSVGIPLLILSLPLVALLTAIIRRESHGPAIFTQERVGLGGKVFTLYKLRTMTLHADDSAQWPNFEATRVTKSGEWLRRSGLDELPQLWNVILGQMSFIGPRPARPLVTERHVGRLPFYAVNFSVKPGISGWAQLHQGQDAGDYTMFEKTRYNLFYAKHFSIWLDLLIYIRTFSQLIRNRKAESVYMKALQSGGNGDQPKVLEARVGGERPVRRDAGG